MRRNKYIPIDLYTFNLNEILYLYQNRAIVILYTRFVKMLIKLYYRKYSFQNVNFIVSTSVIKNNEFSLYF